MALINCECESKCRCTLWAVIASVIIGVVAAFLQITGIITVGDTFLWVVLGIAVVYLAVVLIAAALARNYDGCRCKCNVLTALLAGILGSVLLSVILLAVGITATSVVSAILVGLLLLSFSLLIASTACYIRCLSDCGD